MLYGNITDTSQVLFQFDKIYPSRHSMDENIFNDVIAPNHFVLVSYGYNPQLNDTVTSENSASGYPVVSSDDFIGGYHNEENQVATDQGDTSRIMYVDAYCKHPFEYTTYDQVANPASSQISNYFIERNGFYFKAPYWAEGETYYTPTNATGNKDRYVTAGQIIRRRFNDIEYDIQKNPYPNGYSKEFFICTDTPENMANPDTGSVVGTISAAKFKPLVSVMGQPLITENQNLSTYLTNHLIDAAHYANMDDAFGSLNKGYDGTVWQRVVGEGTEYYVLIAHLNAETQALALIAEPPTSEPEAPFMGADSTSKVATLHLQSPWGFRIKPDENGEVTVVDENGENYTGAIYYNKNGFNAANSNKNTSASNTVSITADGRSSDYSEKYAFSRNGASGHDMLQLSVSLPAIGNMVAEGYDLIYGDGSEEGNTEHVRHRDVAWYDAYSEMRDVGDINLGGKTFDPSSLAGIINTYHDRLGQIIHDINALPNAENIEANWRDDIIYHNTTDGKYYRKGTTYTKHNVTYTYEECTAEAAANYMPNTYLLDTNDAGFNASDVGYFANCFVTNQNATKNLYGDDYGAYQSGKTYYKRVLNDTEAGYIPVNLIPYVSDRYYYSEGNDYYKDVGTTPKYPERNYVEITTYGDYTFSYNYELNTYFISNEDETEFKLSDLPFDPNKTYWSLVVTLVGDRNTLVPYQAYKPGVYYYKDSNNVYRKATTIDPEAGIQYYYLELENVPTGILVDGEEVIGYKVLDAIPVYFPSTGDIDHTIPVYYLDGTDHTYKLVTQEFLLAQNADYFRNPADNPTYIFTTKREITDEIYEADKYYLSETLESGSEHIFLATTNDYSNTNHYFNINVSAPLSKFYYPGMYWFKSNAAGSSYIEATTPTMQSGGNYFIKSDIYVISDAKHKCPYGYIWNLEATCVPWPFELATFDVSKSGAVEITGIDNGEGSVNGKILEIARFLNLQDELTRNGDTVKGALNLLEDKCYTLGNLTPNYLAYANGIGQLTSSSVSHADILTMLSKYNKPAQITMTGYSHGSNTSDIAATDTLNAAIAKLENRIAALEAAQS